MAIQQRQAAAVVVRAPREHGLLIDGVAADGVAHATIRSPYDGALVGSAAQAGPAQADQALAVAHGTLATPLPAHERAAILDATAARIRAEAEPLAQLVSAEVGKPIALARAEVERAVSTFTLSAAVARQLSGRTVPMDAVAAGAGKIAFTRPHPAGVVVAITPFNFPLNLVAHKLAPALAAGCPVVLKPAPQAPLTALALAELMLEAGLPPALLSVLPGTPETLGGTLLTDPRVAVISFTGSSPVGWSIAAAAPRKRVLLELGNAAPAIVAADADVERAAAVLAPNAFSFAGQSCVSVQRVYVERAVHGRFADAFLAAVATQRVGDPADPSVICGPLIDAAALERVTGWIEAAVAGGAALLAGGHPDADGVLAPTVLAEPAQDAEVIQEEVFAPVVSLQPVAGIDEAVARANDTRFGLQAAIFTRDVSTALRAADALRFGAVLVNEAPTFRADQMPYGGVKDSGNTTEGPAFTAAALTEERLVVLQAA